MTLFGNNQGLFQADNLSWIMAGLIIFVIGTTRLFSKRYMAGDRNYHRHTKEVLLLAVSTLVMVFANSLWLMLGGWIVSNLLLVRLMIHKTEWAAARSSGLLALKTFALGMVFLVIGFWLLAHITGTSFIHNLLTTKTGSGSLGLVVALFLIALAAMTQSALWPFHKWLISSLNSPTPVSAMMHAGLVNAGGFLLIRFAPLYLNQPRLLKAIFLVALITAVLGTFWKLIQTDIKRMLACSTMGQMGFMIMQCGMGLYCLAMSHLVWHGVVKAYLFLSSGSAVQEKPRRVFAKTITPASFLLSLILGLGGTYTFALATGKIFNLHDTSAIMLGLAFMVSTQLALTRLEHQLSIVNVIIALIISLAAGLVYGASLRLFEYLLDPLGLFKPQALGTIYISGFVIMVLLWIAINLNITGRLEKNPVWQRLYMSALNGSQPAPDTITSNRTTYQF